MEISTSPRSNLAEEKAQFEEAFSTLSASLRQTPFGIVLLAFWKGLPEIDEDLRLYPFCDDAELLEEAQSLLEAAPDGDVFSLAKGMVRQFHNFSLMRVRQRSVVILERCEGLTDQASRDELRDKLIDRIGEPIQWRRFEANILHMIEGRSADNTSSSPSDRLDALVASLEMRNRVHGVMHRAGLDPDDEVG